MAVKISTILVIALLACDCWSKAEAKFHPRFLFKSLISKVPKEASTFRRNAVETEEVPRPTPVHFGCFLGKNLQLLNNTIIDDNTNAACQKYCYDMKHMFSATHDDTCGCLKDHPEKELSGPQHDSTTMLADDSVHDCTAPCPGHATNKPECEKKFCCGGPGAFTVYQIGGMKCHSLAVIKVLKDYNVDVEQSHFTPVLNEINRKTQIPMEELKKEIKKPAEPADYKVLLKELTQSKVSQGANADKGWRNQWKDVVGIQDDVQADKIPNANACCSPDCDWLLNFLEIDKTVVKCVD